MSYISIRIGCGLIPREEGWRYGIYVVVVIVAGREWFKI